jgi:hypothetical protein
LLEDAKVLRPDLNLSGATWDDVCEHIRQYIEDAQSTYEAKGKNNKVRSMFRNGETVAVVAQHMVELFPDEFGLGTLRAGLSYIFQVCTNPDVYGSMIDSSRHGKRGLKTPHRFWVRYQTF